MLNRFLSTYEKWSSQSFTACVTFLGRKNLAEGFQVVLRSLISGSDKNDSAPNFSLLHMNTSLKLFDHAWSRVSFYVYLTANSNTTSLFFLDFFSLPFSFFSLLETRGRVWKLFFSFIAKINIALNPSIELLLHKEPPPTPSSDLSGKLSSLPSLNSSVYHLQFKDPIADNGLIQW